MRPTGITILAVLYAIGGILGIVGGALSFDAVALVLGVVEVAIAYGLWNGQNWSRILVMIFSILGIIGSAVMIALGPTLMMFMLKANPTMASKMGMFLGMISTVFTVSGIIGIVINVIILYYLTRPHVKEFFTA
jgi:MFS family permease